MIRRQGELFGVFVKSSIGLCGTGILVVGAVLGVLSGVVNCLGAAPAALLDGGTPPPVLSELLRDDSGRAITSVAAWEKQREKLRARWEKFLGPFPAKPPLDIQWGTNETCDGFQRQLVKYQVEDGVYVDGYLLTPTRVAGRLPAVVVFHPTTPFQARGVAGLERDYPEEKWQGIHLVRRGYLVWCPRNFIYEQGTNWSKNAQRVLALHTNWTGMTRMVWDAIRAADFVQSLTNVDTRRMGCLGHSLGGKEVLFAMAFDKRYAAGVSSEGGIGLKFSNWDAIWYLGPRIRQPGFTLENHELLAMVAPRAFLLIGGDSADKLESVDFINAADPVYDLYGARKNIGFFDHHLGHRYPPDAREAAEIFLGRHLNN
jgi:dienelactone hydrolase